MTEIGLRIYEHFKVNKTFYFSQDASLKLTEMQAIQELESNGCITVKMRTIGYVIAEISG